MCSLLLTGGQALAAAPAAARGRTVTIDVKDAEIGNVLRLIAETGGLNLVVGDDVKGRVTLHLRRVVWDQALLVVLRLKGLGSERYGNVLRVAPVERLLAEREARARQAELADLSAPLKTWLIPVSYARAADLLPQVQATLSPRGTAFVDERANVIIVHDIER
ncbi:MAG: pilus assembly protein PilQ [Deltaproteobacteria bacterium]|nr:pilus assembly protein PilQ [Deltaproteobacteria bacterium]